MSSYKPRESFWTYEAYLKNRNSSCHYNRGLYFVDPSGAGYNRTSAIIEFQKAICEDKHNEDAKYQLEILYAHDKQLVSACFQLDCSGCLAVRNEKT